MRIINKGIILFCTLTIFLICSKRVFSEIQPAASDNRVEEKVIDDVTSDVDYVPGEIDYVTRGADSLKEGNYEEAVEDFKKAREKDPKSSVAAFYLGVAYKKMQDYGEAKVNLRDAITLMPPVKEAVAELADVLYQLGEVEETLNVLSIAEKEGIESARTAYLKGLVLLKLGRGKESVVFFEKAKSMDGQLSGSVDYQIALANLQDGNLAEAKKILKEIVIRDPNSDIAQYANQYIDAITKRLNEENPLTLAAGLQYQFDNNVVLKPGDVTVAGDIAHQSDSAAIATLRGEYSPKLKGHFGIKTQYSLYLSRYNHLSDYDVQSHTIAIVPNYNFRQSQVSLNASYNQTLVNDYKYLHDITISPSYMYLISERQFIRSSVRYLRKEYLRPPVNSDEDRDSGDTGFGLSWVYLIADGKGFINARYDFNRENTDGVNWRYKGSKVGFSLLYPLIESLRLNLGGEGYAQDFEHTHTAFARKRNDTMYTMYSQVTYTLFNNIDLNAQYVFIRGDSNIALYDYDKSTITIGVEARLP